MQYFQWKNEPKYNIESMNWSKGPDNQRPFVKQKIIWSASASRELLINHEENDGLLLCTCPKREKKIQTQNEEQIVYDVILIWT